MKEKMKTFWIVLISFVASAVIVGGGTYYFVNSQATKDKDALQSQITDLNKRISNTEKSLADAQAVVDENTSSATQTPTTTSTTQTPTSTTATTPTASSNIPAGWKTYTSSTYGYSISYPSDWTVKDMHTTFGVQDTFGVEPPNTSANWIVTVSVNNSDQYGTTITQGTDGTASTFAGKSATKYTLGNGYQYQFQSNGKYYVIGVTYNESMTSQATRTTAGQIADTFALN